jgi:uncharacterized coiled-coil protein SlyX
MPGKDSDVDSSVPLSLEERVSRLAQKHGVLERAMEETQGALAQLMDTVERMAEKQDVIMARLDAMRGMRM